VGFEPTNNGFAIRRLSPLGYAAGIYLDSICIQSKRSTLRWHAKLLPIPITPFAIKRTVSKSASLALASGLGFNFIKLVFETAHIFTTLLFQCGHDIFHEQTHLFLVAL
jgi:hypothetical protein